MKVRDGFVSNSSSSSFVIGVEPETEGFEVVLKVSFDDLNATRISTLKELDAYYTDEYVWKSEDLLEALEEEQVLEEYQRAVKVINEGKVIYCGSVGNDYGSPIANFLYSNGFGDLDKRFTIIRED